MVKLRRLLFRLVSVVLAIGQVVLFPLELGARGIPVVFDFDNVKELLGYLPSSYLTGIRVSQDSVNFAWKRIKRLQGRQFSKLEKETNIKFFLVALAVPDNELWVNLNVFLNELQVLGRKLLYTDIGKVLMYSDVKLKEDVKRLAISLGIWDELLDYAYGMSSEKQDWEFNPRFWIVPGEIEAFISKDGIFIKSAKLNVMFQLEHSVGGSVCKDEFQSRFEAYASKIIKEKLIPALERRVNNELKYAPLRQVYQACILAQWYKKFQANRVDFVFSKLVNSCALGGLLSTKQWTPRKFLDEYVRMYKQDLWDTWGDDWQFYGGGVDFRSLIHYVKKVGLIDKIVNDKEFEKLIREGVLRIEAGRFNKTKATEAKAKRRKAFLPRLPKRLIGILAVVTGIGLLSVISPGWAFDLQTAFQELIRAAAQHGLNWAFVSSPDGGMWVIDLHNKGLQGLVDQLAWIIKKAGYYIDKNQLAQLLFASAEKTTKMGMNLYYLPPDLLSQIAKQATMMGPGWVATMDPTSLASQLLATSQGIREQAVNLLAMSGLLQVWPQLDRFFAFLAKYRWQIVGIIGLPGLLYGVKRLYDRYKSSQDKDGNKKTFLLLLFGATSAVLASSLLIPGSAYSLIGSAVNSAVQYKHLLEFVGSQITLNFSHTKGLELIIPQNLVSTIGSVQDFTLQLLTELFKGTGVSVQQLLSSVVVTPVGNSFHVSIAPNTFTSLGLNLNEIKDIVTEFLAKAVLYRLPKEGLSNLPAGTLSSGLFPSWIVSGLLGIGGSLLIGEVLRATLKVVDKSRQKKRLADQGFALFGEGTKELEENSGLAEDGKEIFNTIVGYFSSGQRKEIEQFIKADKTVKGEIEEQIKEAVDKIFNMNVSPTLKAVFLADLLASMGVKTTGVKDLENDSIGLFILYTAWQLKRGGFDNYIEEIAKYHEELYKSAPSPEEIGQTGQEGGIILSGLVFSPADSF